MYDPQFYEELIALNKTTNPNDPSSSTAIIIDISVAVFFCTLMIFNLLVGTCLNSCFLITIAFNKKLRVQKYVTLKKTTFN
jgi:hypothetical protein